MTYFTVSRRKLIFFGFQKKGFPEGELGLLMALALEMKIEGLDSVVKPLKWI
ncbi:hypothetical protein C9J03_00005 [Photobacterium gaetbulicola]|uniref:putative quorum-sensing-regulated virulence factor n=1 Tax=Photobacterium gaetbulicola TaxID=1295392 RepID=UPI0009E3A800|nr:hypothetical protein C9J03_00005 [Photobacterium gaetbulicola]